jgi:hypothetical protein
MNRRAYFLSCLNVHLLAWLSSSTNPRSFRHESVAAFQSEAWTLPEWVIPFDPGTAALEFFLYCTGNDRRKPRWLAEYEDSLVKETTVR